MYRSANKNINTYKYKIYIICIHVCIFTAHAYKYTKHIEDQHDAAFNLYVVRYESSGNYYPTTTTHKRGGGCHGLSSTVSCCVYLSLSNSKFYLDIIMIVAIVFSSRPSLTERNPHAFNCTSWKFRVKENSCESGGFWDVSCEVPRPEVPFSHQCTP